MSKRKTISKEELRKREKELFMLQYQDEDNVEILQFEKYHFRVVYKKQKTVDVWPVSKKYYTKTFPSSKIYQNVSEILKAVV